jgi:hypothetical protein
MSGFTGGGLLEGLVRWLMERLPWPNEILLKFSMAQMAGCGDVKLHPSTGSGVQNRVNEGPFV